MVDNQISANSGAYAVNSNNGKIHITGACPATGSGRNAMKDLVYFGIYDDGGYPYAVPLSYVYGDRTLYFHCAKSGHKLDAIETYDKVSLCVIDQDLVTLR